VVAAAWSASSRQREDWVDPPADAGARHRNGANGGQGHRKPQEIITEAKVKGWVEITCSPTPPRLEEIMAARGLEHETLLAYEIGWDRTVVPTQSRSATPTAAS
jgi:hypothetical protein